jgi:hypothetical protein
MLNYNRFRGLRGNSVIPSVILKPTHWISNGGVGGAIRNLVTQVSIFVILINLININPVFAKETTKTYQMEYLRQLEYSSDQYDCLSPLITMESRWQLRAKNGSHHGLPQGRSKFLATADHKAQITWHIKYLKHRYGTDRFGVANACGAWSHWLMKGWH